MLLGAICELCALLHLHGGRNHSLSFTSGNHTPCRQLLQDLYSHVPRSFVVVDMINTHIQCHDINNSQSKQWPPVRRTKCSSLHH